eukprot:TRINITY_DN5969_c0_g1_i1.p1 TRINITY_DN5969_c0_g1~~TRINITY_DN5969_c0_g1_i1.p1  ORF type:complete len:227 (+),score=55.41 TRINITY_DN5969_c0_g1_i1:217-897(+)
MQSLKPLTQTLTRLILPFSFNPSLIPLYGDGSKEKYLIVILEKIGERVNKIRFISPEKGRGEEGEGGFTVTSLLSFYQRSYPLPLVNQINTGSVMKMISKDLPVVMFFDNFLSPLHSTYLDWLKSFAVSYHGRLRFGLGDASIFEQALQEELSLSSYSFSTSNPVVFILHVKGRNQIKQYLFEEGKGEVTTEKLTQFLDSFLAGELSPFVSETAEKERQERAKHLA